jgi:hypothetical protein
MHTLAPTTPPPLRILESDLAALTLDRGQHWGPHDGHCLMEVVSMFAGEPFTDSPACVDPVLANFGTTWNDCLDHGERQALKQYIPQLLGTAKGEELSQRRGWMAADWLVRMNAPAWLELSPALAEHAAKLRALAEITGLQQLASAMPAIDQAQRAAAEAKSAAGGAWNVVDFAVDQLSGDASDVVRDAAEFIAVRPCWISAWQATHDTALDAAWSAASNAARDAHRKAGAKAARAGKQAARDAASAAALQAAYAALDPTQVVLRASLHELYARMIAAQPLEA